MPLKKLLISKKRKVSNKSRKSVRKMNKRGGENTRITDFGNRHASVKPGTRYNKGYEPYSKSADSLLAGFEEPGSWVASNFPKWVGPVTMSGYRNGKYIYDDYTGFEWPIDKTDSEYINGKAYNNRNKLVLGNPDNQITQV